MAFGSTAATSVPVAFKASAVLADVAVGIGNAFQGFRRVGKADVRTNAKREQWGTNASLCFGKPTPLPHRLPAS